VVLIASVGAEPVRCRLGLTVSRRVGGAVVRNRVKRRVREWFRENHGAIGPGCDVVVIARPGAGQLRSSEIRRELTDLVAQEV
jgi:ribonuclease P protein component